MHDMVIIHMPCTHLLHCAKFVRFTMLLSGAGSDNSWAQNGTTASRPLEQHSSLYGPGLQKEASGGPKSTLFSSHSAHYTEPPLSPEPHSMHLPEDLLEPAGMPSFGPNHLVCSIPLTHPYV